MITTERDKRICDRYRFIGADGYVHCKECPLRRVHDKYNFMCKANSHYNHKTKEWEYDVDR